MTEPKNKILLIGWDAADWQHIHPLIEAGLMPTLEGMINDGVMGNLGTLKPVLSPMLWNTVATGKLPDQHGIHGFVEPDRVNGGVRPCASTSRKVKALWNILTQQGLRSNVVGWWASHPAEPIAGTVVSNYFTSSKYSEKTGFEAVPGTVHPQDREEYLAQFRVLPSELTHEHILPFIPKAAKIDQVNDRRLQDFGRVLTDCASIHAVATTVMEEDEWDFTAIYYDAIDHFCHAFMPYHPPQMTIASDEDFEIYREVISGAYRFHDMMLDRLLQLAGPETTVILCSDHGFESGNQRPLGVSLDPAGPADWHRDFGIIVMKGPGIKKDELVYGASLVDIAPTILTMFGLPVGADMEGRPLVEAFAESPKVETIPSWEDVPGECGMHPKDSDANALLKNERSEELVKQFVALGYIQDPSQDKSQSAKDAQVELDYNLAQTYVFKGMPNEARNILERLLEARPWENRFIYALARCYFDSGYHAQAERLLRAAFPDDDLLPAAVRLLLGRTLLARHHRDDALTVLLPALESSARQPGVHAQLGETFLGLRRNADAKAAFEKSLSIHPEYATAHQGLSSVYLREREFELAAECALDAIGLVYRLPIAHYNLGVALAQLGELERAVTAFEVVLSVNKGFLNAHRWLARLYHRLGRAERSEQHATTAKSFMSRLSVDRPVRSARSTEFLPLPEIPSPAERLRITIEDRNYTQELPPSGKTFTIVSGLPRSGTSLMMQILSNAGIEPKTDGERIADDDNPEGYYEWEAIKLIHKQPELFDEQGLEEKAIKVISMLVHRLPKHHQYKVIFMMRPIEEIVASQRKMIERLGSQGSTVTTDKLQYQLDSHRTDILEWLDAAKNIEVLKVDFPKLIADPDVFVDPLLEFLGPERLPRTDTIAATVRPELHRQRS